jgi:hypothetical protein
MRRFRTITMGLALAAWTLAGCSARLFASTATIVATPDVCAPPLVKLAAGQVNEFTQQFDDESALASNVSRTELPPYIAGLQGIRRAAQNQAVPACLMQLKQLQLTHMNTVITTMLAFLGGGDQSGISQGMGVARQQHDQYVLELARILDVTPTVVTPPPTVAVTPQATQPTPPTAPAGTGMLAVNPGPYPINLRAAPSKDARLVTTLDVGKSVVAVAETADGQWLQVLVPDHPDQMAWVLATDVRLGSPTP